MKTTVQLRNLLAGCFLLVAFWALALPPYHSHATSQVCVDAEAPIVFYPNSDRCLYDTVSIDIVGNLNDAEAWYIYADSCGGQLIDTTSAATYDLFMAQANMTIYIRGEGGCTNPGPCSVTDIQWTQCTNYTGITTLYVDQFGKPPSLENGESWDDAFRTLYEALAVADTVPWIDSIFVARGEYRPAPNNPAPDRHATFSIRDSLVVLGAFPRDGGPLSSRDVKLHPTELDGDIDNNGNLSNNSYHVVTFDQVSSATVIDGFTIQNGNADYSGFAYNSVGGGMINVGDGAGNSSHPVIRNCQFSNNYASSSGGAFCNFVKDGSGNPTFIDCSFFFNEAGSDGGAIYNYANFADTDIELTTCKFQGNSAKSGGAIFDFAGMSYWTITNSVISGNLSHSKGGALYADGIQGNGFYDFINCTVVGNRSDGEGGAFYGFAYVSDIEISPINTVVYLNADANGTDSSSASFVTPNSAQLEPRFSFVHHTTLMDSLGNVDGSIDPLMHKFNDPVAAPTSTGDIDLYYCSPLTNAGNNDSIPSGISFDYSGDPRIVDGTVDIGAFEAPFVEYISTYHIDSMNIGGLEGLSWSDAFSIIQGVLEHPCLGPGDTVYVAEGTYFPDALPGQSGQQSATFELTDSVVYLGGFAPNLGIDELMERDPDVYATTLSGEIQSDSIQTNNSHHVITTNQHSPLSILDGFCIVDGYADQGTGGHSVGGGWHNINGSPTLRNCVFKNNFATSTGGAMNNDGENGGDASPNYENCRFENNHSGLEGGAVYNGGAHGNSSPIFTDCQFINNTSNTGGAVSSSGREGASSPLFYHCTFERDSADILGGAIRLGSLNQETKSQIIDCTFHSNHATAGGAISLQSTDSQDSVLIQNSSFVSNGAEIYGGAIFLSGQSVTTQVIMNRNQFVDNHASSAGGGLYQYATGTGQIDVQYENCTFTGNDGSENGGALVTYCNGAGMTTKLINPLMKGNIANNGAAFYSICDTGSLSTQMIQATLAGNRANVTGGATLTEASGSGENELIFVNSIIWNNEAASRLDSAIVVDTGSATTSFYHSLAQYVTVDDTLGNLAGHLDPLFANPISPHLSPTSSGSYRLKHCSPAIDAGSNDSIPPSVSLDLDSLPRVFNSIVDLGVYESQQQPITYNGELFVNANGPVGDGTSWSNALIDLQDALLHGCLSPGDTVFVSAGTYYPDKGQYVSEDDSAVSFHLPDGVVVLGGFDLSSGDTTLSAQNPEAHLTRLSGEINGDSLLTGNTRSVIRTHDVSATTVLNGFVISDGNGINGGGWLNQVSPDSTSSPTILHCTFENNYASGMGGAFHNDGRQGSVSPLIRQCQFLNNSSVGSGGGMSVVYDSGYCAPQIIDCVFEENSSGFHGAGLYIGGTSGVDESQVDSCRFALNSTFFFGGGIALFADSSISRANVLNSEFTVDTAYAGAGISIELSDSSTHEGQIEHCLFDSNFSTQGTAIYIIADKSRLSSEIRENIMSKNRANVGGAFYNVVGNSYVDMRVIDCLFENNYSEFSGGAMGLNAAGNSDYEPQIQQCTFRSNTAGSYGGAISCRSENPANFVPTFSSCLITGNYAESGGAWHNLYEVKTRIINCTVAGNYAQNKGGGLFNEGDFLYGDPIVEITNSLIAENADGAGISGISNLLDESGASTNMSFSLIQFTTSEDSQGNLSGTADPGFIDPIDPDMAPTIDGDYAVVSCSPVVDAGQNDSIPIWDSMDITGGQRIRYGLVDIGAYEIEKVKKGILYVDSLSSGGDGMSWDSAFTNLQEALNWGCPEAGDSVFVSLGTYLPVDEYPNSSYRAISFVLPDSVHFYGGFSTSDGVTSFDDRDYDLFRPILSGEIQGDGDSTNNSHHVLYAENLSSATLMEGFIIRDGRAFYTNDAHAGAALYMKNSSPKFHYCDFINNASDDTGGAVFCLADSQNQIIPAFSHCTFTENQSRIFGGAVMMAAFHEAKISPDFSHCQVIDNESLYSIGGGLFMTGYDVSEVSPTIYDCEFLKNTASSGGGLTVYIRDTATSHTTVAQCRFDSNEVDGDSGGALLYALYASEMTAHFDNVEFNANSADLAGGLLVLAAHSAVMRDTIINSRFYSNYAAQDGAGLSRVLAAGGYAYSHVQNCEFKGNEAVRYGAGLFEYGNVGGIMSSTIVNTVFSGNHAVGNGAGFMALQENGGTLNPRLINCTVSGNLADGSGGGIYLAGEAGNQMQAVLSNSLVTNNVDQSGTATAESSITSVDANPSISYSIVQGITVDDSLGNIAGTQNPNYIEYVNIGDVPTIGGNLRIQYGPAVNVGSNDSIANDVAIDLDSVPRIIGSRVDLGAYEFDFDFPCGQYHTLHIDEQPIHMATYKAVSTLSSDGLVNTNSEGHVIFQSQSEIELQAGFEVELGSTFDAQILDPCSD